MNIYKIIFTHYSPKDSEEGIACLLIAENDEQVYEWIASDPQFGDMRIFTSWKDMEDEELEDAEMPFKEKMISICGEVNDEDADLSDLYYGKTLYGWQLLKEDIDINKDVPQYLIDKNIIVTIK